MGNIYCSKKFSWAYLLFSWKWVWIILTMDILSPSPKASLKKQRQTARKVGVVNTLSNKMVFRWSYGHNSKCAKLPWSNRMYYILRTYAYDTWNIFYGLWSHTLRHKPTKSGGAWQIFRDLNVKNQLESHFFFDKTCIVCHTVMIQRALHSPDLGKCFTYSKHLRTTHEKIFTSFGIQILWQKHTQNYSSKMSWPHLRLFKVHLNLKNHEKTLRY